MRSASTNEAYFTGKRQIQERASIRIALLAAVSFLLGVSATAFWFHQTAQPGVESPTSPGGTRPPAVPAAAPAANAPSPGRPVVEAAPPVNAAAIAEVKRAIPNFASVSVENGTRILQQAALKNFAAAAKTMDEQVKQAQRQLVQAENSQSPAEQQAAMKRLQQVQTAQAQKLQQIAARLQAQIAALKQLKKAE
ncbi:MAG: hypothetical protein KGJ60_08885 [Verrucomicrobiota bacterium]|nr:hypothetical protein [Verrucomicrobiota bacterium]